MSHHEIKGRLNTYSLTLNETGHVQIFNGSEKSKTGPRPMISARNSAREVERMLGRFQLKKGLLAVVMGAASLPLLQKLVEQKKEQGGEIILFEADDVFGQFLYQQFTAIYSEVNIITPLNAGHLQGFIETFAIENFLGYRIFKNSASLAIEPGFYQQQEFSFKKTFSSRFSDLFTRLEFEPSWIFNSLAQVSQFNRALPVKKLFGLARGQTAVLVSTGPSLRKALPALVKMQNEVFIACVDSAYRILHNYGIRPHMLISLDSQPFTLRHIMGLPWGRPGEFPFLYADLVANPQVTFRWQGPLFLGLTAQYLGDQEEIRAVTPGSDYVEKLVAHWLGQPRPEGALGDVQSGGSVATSLFDLLRQMQFERIILAGQDFAYTNREIHCVGTHHTEQWLSSATNRLNSLENINNAVLKKRHIQMVKNPRGRLVPEDYVLSLYRGWFAEAAAKVGFDVFNFSQDTLPIENCLPFDFSKHQFKNQEEFYQALQKTFGSNSIAPDPAMVDQLLHDLAGAKISQELVESHNFFERIGRKHRILGLRKALSGNEAQAGDWQQKQYDEQVKFMQKLRRGAQNWCNFAGNTAQ